MNTQTLTAIYAGNTQIGYGMLIMVTAFIASIMMTLSLCPVKAVGEVARFRFKFSLFMYIILSAVFAVYAVGEGFADTFQVFLGIVGEKTVCGQEGHLRTVGDVVLSVGQQRFLKSAGTVLEQDHLSGNVADAVAESIAHGSSEQATKGTVQYRQVCHVFFRAGMV